MAKNKTPKPKQPSDDELKRQHERFMVRWKSLTSVAKFVVVGATIVGFGFVSFYLPVQVAHGEETTITHVNKFLADISANVILAWGAAASAAIWGAVERKQKLNEREQRDKRIREFEREKDQNVTSSKLNVSGTRRATK